MRLCAETPTAGVELEQSVCGLGDGARGGTRLFSCAAGRGLFVPLALCRRDARFRDTPPPDPGLAGADPHLDQVREWASRLYRIATSSSPTHNGRGGQ